MCEDRSRSYGIDMRIWDNFYKNHCPPELMDPGHAKANQTCPNLSPNRSFGEDGDYDDPRYATIGPAIPPRDYPGSQNQPVYEEIQPLGNCYDNRGISAPQSATRSYGKN